MARQATAGSTGLEAVGARRTSPTAARAPRIMGRMRVPARLRTMIVDSPSFHHLVTERRTRRIGARLRQTKPREIAGLIPARHRVGMKIGDGNDSPQAALPHRVRTGHLETTMIGPARSPGWNWINRL